MMTEDQDELSVEAKVVAGVYWGVGGPFTEISFDRPWIIHPRMRKGLDELVDAGLLTVEKFNNVSDKLVWKPTPKMKTHGPKVTLAFIKAHSFPVTDESQPKPD